MEDDFMGCDDTYGSAKCEPLMPDLTIRQGMSELQIKRINEIKAQMDAELDIINDMMGGVGAKVIAKTASVTEAKTTSLTEAKTASVSEAKTTSLTEAKKAKGGPKPTVSARPTVSAKPVKSTKSTKLAKQTKSAKYDDEYDYDEYSEYDNLYND
jgi:hypothetical protein